MQNDNEKLKIIKYLGIDWGESRVGLAMGDNTTNVALPFQVVNNINEVLKIVRTEDINIIVLGKPIKMSGNEKLSDEFNMFYSSLKSKLDIPIELVDERLSSKQADTLPGNKKTKAEQDAIAAMLILQTYLDKINGSHI